MKTSASPQSFFLTLGMMTSLVIAVISLLGVIFQFANAMFADPLSPFVDPYSSGLRTFLSLLIVSYPLFIGLSWLKGREIAKGNPIRESKVYRWLMYLGLFVVSAVIAVTAVVLLNNFLSGELTSRFIVKSLSTLVVMKLVGAYLYFDLKGRWSDLSRKNELNILALVSTVAILVLVVAGIVKIGSPSAVRLMRFDEQKVSDLQNIQYQILDHYQRTGKLPAQLEALNDQLAEYSIPSDPQTKQKYGYTIEGPLTFSLCADFNKESKPGQLWEPGYFPGSLAEPAYPGIIKNERWDHSAGNTCFSRTIDPIRFPVRK